MQTETMTVHKALCEIKILDDRIRKAISNPVFVATAPEYSDKVDGISKKQKMEDIQAAYKSATDLILRRDLIKRAIMVSNAITEVAICGVKYRVAAAIEMMQNGIKYKEALVEKLRRDYTRAVSLIDRGNEDAKNRADAFVASSLPGKGKTKDSEAQEMYNAFLKNHSISMIDPLEIKKLIETLEKEIDAFKAEVDGALATSNATTMIEISY